MNGEIFFNMFKDAHPLYGRSEFLLKRWQKHTIYSLSGSYKRTESSSWHKTDDLRFNMYSTSSVYLYDYVVVSDTWFLNSVYSSSIADFTPAASHSYAGSIDGTASYVHYANTWRDSPNAITNDYLLRYNPTASLMGGHAIYGYAVDATLNLPPPPESYHELMRLPIYRDDGTFFEIVRGYPRNHYTHKRSYLSLERYISYGLIGRQVTSASYRRGMQTIETTVGPTGLGDGSTPVQVTQVTNIELIKSDNVIYH